MKLIVQSIVFQGYKVDWSVLSLERFTQVILK